MLEKTGNLFRPKHLIVGFSAHPRDIDYPCMRKVTPVLMLLLELFFVDISSQDCVQYSFCWLKANYI